MDADKKERRSYSREFKLSVGKWVEDNNQTLASASRHFKIDRKQIRSWTKENTKIIKQKYKSKASGRGCTARFPGMEIRLIEEYKEMRKVGKSVKS